MDGRCAKLVAPVRGTQPFHRRWPRARYVAQLICYTGPMTRHAYTRLLYVTLFCLSWLVGSGAAQDVTADLLGRMNTLRSSLGLAPYSLNASLSAAAQDHAQWMADTGQIVHTRPDGSTPRSRASAAGYGSGWVSENIFMGGRAGAGDAWNFWLNSPIHYAGLTNASYRDVGIGSASGASGRTFVLVFGNPGGAPVAPQAGGNQAVSAPAAPPSYVVGLDERGNIMHEVQPGDTFGDIALIYGYTWDAIPDMLALNGMTEADIRDLEVGSVILVPPQAGTYTPTPDPSTPPPAPTDEPIVASPTATANAAIQSDGAQGQHTPASTSSGSPAPPATAYPVPTIAVRTLAEAPPSAPATLAAPAPAIAPAFDPLATGLLFVQVAVLASAVFAFVIRWRR
jgi:uncharacterized protein YkwD